MDGRMMRKANPAHAQIRMQHGGEKKHGRRTKRRIRRMEKGRKEPVSSNLALEAAQRRLWLAKNTGQAVMRMVPSISWYQHKMYTVSVPLITAP